jgi:hypothetical protein
MLKVQLLRKCPPDDEETSPGVLVGFIIQGHAEFAEHGQDIVCAGASAIAQAALLGLKDFLGERVSFEKRPGFLEVSIERQAASETQSKAIMRVLELGLQSICRAYAGHIDIRYCDVV